MRRVLDEKLKSHVKADGARRHRLAAELRANLKKRKDRGRALAKAGRAAPPTDSDKG
jgi:hypothetical protein